MKNLLLFLFILPLVGLGQTYIPGETYYSDQEYIEYLAGNLPIILSAPHGGDLEPASIPDRDCSGCVYVKDSYTQELGRELSQAIINATGCFPHLIINRLHRRKLDANRDLGDAADGNAEAENAWTAFHDFINYSKNKTTQDYSKGLYLDLHGHGHSIQRIELGYLLSKEELQLSDGQLNSPTYVDQSSIKNLVTTNLGGHSHAELLRGSSSLGAMLENRTYPNVPSPGDPYPLSNEAYFRGGYNTNRHSSVDGGTIDGIQIECNQTIRFETDVRQAFADSFALIILDYLEQHYLADFSNGFCQGTTVVKDILEENPVVVYPNPVEDLLIINTRQNPATLDIFNNLGQQVMGEVLISGKTSIDLSHLRSGMYFLQIHSGGFLKSNKKIVKR